jgi:radical SAM superfamily enzyme YgiQ (UPF0313 family)
LVSNRGSQGHTLHDISRTLDPPAQAVAGEATASRTVRKTLSICLINPRFDPSYWGFDFALPLYPGDKRSTMIAGGLPTVAGLVPAGHRVTIIDENVEELDFESLRGYDIVGLTGMIVQKRRMREILLRLKAMGIFTIVGGAYCSVDREFFEKENLCEVIFSGEAEETWPQFIEDYAAGRPFQRYYEQADRTDMTKVPVPRYDLLKVDRYASGALQFSRGCPFQCEFCDIIVTFGRKPRTKKPEQVISELEEMVRAGFHSVFIVDDNFIGNKKAAKELLEMLVEWQEKNSYPVRLSTEASINLADDPRLLDLMYRANFRHVFIGIETPRMDSLKEVKKLQNTHGDSIEAKLARIQNAGLDIHAGFIVGFDSDDLKIFDDQFKFIQDNGILLAMVGMLGAIPKTPLYDRLKAEGRLVDDDPNCNFIPKQMTREQLREGYWKLVEKLYTPENFLERYFRSYRYPEYHRRRAEISKKAAEGKAIPTLAYGLLLLKSLTKTLAKDGSLKKVGSTYAKYFVKSNLKYRRDIIGFAQFMNRCVTHWHFYKFTRLAVAGKLRTYNSG